MKRYSAGRIWQTIVIALLVIGVGVFGALGTFVYAWDLDDLEPSSAVWPFPAQSEIEGEEEDCGAIVYYDHADASLDFAALAASETDSIYRGLAEYFASVTPSKENDYTGIYRNKNLIFLLCESFSPYVIDETLTPYMWELTHRGFAFNFYNTVPTNTSNSEYCAITSLMPDHWYRDQGWSAFYSNSPASNSATKYLPYTIGNQFKALGLRSMGFHYNYGRYYKRNKSHPNFGYDFYTLDNYLKGYSWPNSDLEMIKQAMPKILEKDKDGNITQFNAYFLTFSGHSSGYGTYSIENSIVKKYLSVKRSLTYKKETVKNYVTAHQDLEKACEYIYKSLEEAGILQDTIICISADHYPYALGLTDLSELAGKKLNATAQDKFLNQQKGIFTIYDAGMDGLVEISSPVCSYDITPTLSNLWGFDYDSRLLMGRDALSQSDEHVAVFYDFGFVTEDYFYMPSTKTAYALDGSKADDETQAAAKEMVSRIAKEYEVSKQVLKYDYYRHILQ